MDKGDLPRLIYLVLLLAVVGGYFLVENRNRLGKTAQQAAIWGLIFLGAVAVAGLWGDIQRHTAGRGVVAASDGRIEVPVSEDGHFYLMAEVNGADVLFVVDTGATHIVLTQGDAEHAGLEPDTLNYFGSATTANGVVKTAPVRLATFKLGETRHISLPAVVNGGALDTSLLGMSYLSRYQMTMTGDLLSLQP
ncbi:MAG: TIGR02281 family clan AA aspartic protease [Albidovulum sp.]